MISWQEKRSSVQDLVASSDEDADCDKLNTPHLTIHF